MRFTGRVENFITEVILPLTEQGLIRSDKGCEITPLGIEELTTLDKKAKAALAVKLKPARISMNKANYDGRELGETCMRPGAYDFTKYPSIVNGERVYRKKAG